MSDNTQSTKWLASMSGYLMVEKHSLLEDRNISTIESAKEKPQNTSAQLPVKLAPKWVVLFKNGTLGLTDDPKFPFGTSWEFLDLSEFADVIDTQSSFAEISSSSPELSKPLLSSISCFGFEFESNSIHVRFFCKSPEEKIQWKHKMNAAIKKMRKNSLSQRNAGSSKFTSDPLEKNRVNFSLSLPKKEYKLREHNSLALTGQS